MSFGSGAAPVLAQDEGDAGDAPVMELERVEFKWEKPRTVVIYPGSDDRSGSSGEILAAGRIYWYMPYTLTYKGKEEAQFFVSINAKSDKDKKYTDLALPHVERKVERLEQRKLFSKVDAIAKGKQGARYVTFAPGEAKQCVAIFNPLNQEADTIEITVHGLVNDLKVENLGDGRFRIEERVLRLTFKRPGDELYTSLDSIKFAGKKWDTIVTTMEPEK